MTTLNKTRTVLGLDYVGSNSVTFVAEEKDLPFVSIDQEVWADMDEPTQVTVTVEPGDRLN